MLVRSPTMTNPISGVMLSGSSPESFNELSASILREKLPGLEFFYHRFDGPNVIWGRAATTADQVQPAVLRPFCQLRSEALRRFRKSGLRKWIGQTCVWICA